MKAGTDVISHSDPWHVRMAAGNNIPWIREREGGSEREKRREGETARERPPLHESTIVYTFTLVWDLLLPLT